jgi:hypothetical protein
MQLYFRKKEDPAEFLTDILKDFFNTDTKQLFEFEVSFDIKLIVFGCTVE